MTLRRRLYVAAAVVLIVFVAAGTLVIRSAERSEVDQVDQQIKTDFPVLAVTILGQTQTIRPPTTAGISGTGRLSPNASTTPAQGGVGLSAHATRSNFISNDFYVAKISSGNRRVIAKPLNAAGQSPQVPAITSAPRAANFQIVTVESLQGSGRWRAVLIRGPGPNTNDLLALSLRQVDATIAHLRLALIAAGLLLLLVLGAAGFWVGRLGLRPIAEVTEVADGITAGDRTRRVTGVRSGTEAGHLAEAFNVMLDEQQGIEGRLRQFVADTSHELRTPLAAIQGVTGLWRQGDLRSPEANDDAMRRIGRESAAHVQAGRGSAAAGPPRRRAIV